MNYIKSFGFSLAAIAALGLSGCGGGSSDVKTGTAYYVDAAVAGAEYTCGTQSGTTGADGSFTFEVGQSCSFEVAGITLREMSAEELYDGKKVVEDDPNVARFLQSLDVDGDPSNGITIKEEVVEVLEETLSTLEDPTAVLEDPDTLESVVSEVANEVSDFAGVVPSDEAVEEHLTQTLTEVTEELLLDKTFYVAGSYEEDDGIHYELLEIKVTRSGDDLIMNWKKLSGSGESGTEPIKIEGNKLIFLDDDDGSYTLIEDHGDYIYADDRNADGSKDGTGHWLYTDKAKAEAKYEELKSQVGIEDDEGDEAEDDATESTDVNLTSLIVGKTFYEHCKDEEGDWIDTLVFQSDGKIKLIESDGNVEYYAYRIDEENDIVYVTDEEGEEAHPYISHTDTSITFGDPESGEGENDTFYTSEDAAQSAVAEDCGDGDDDHLKFTTDMLVGKTYYFVQYDDFGTDITQWNIAKVTFVNDNTFTWQEYSTDDTQEYTLSYSIDENGSLILDYGDGSDIGTDPVTLEEVTEDYLKVCEEGDCDTYLFFDEDKALAFKEAKNLEGTSDLTTSIVSQNPWYVVEYFDDGSTYCDGKFTLGSDGTLTVNYYDENGNEQTFSGNYEIYYGTVVVRHNDKIDLERLESQTGPDFVTISREYDEVTKAFLHEKKVYYFADYEDALTFGNDHGVDCSQYIPE